MSGSKIGQKPPAQTNQIKKPTAPKTTPQTGQAKLDPKILEQLIQAKQAQNTAPATAAPPQPPAPPQGNGDQVTVSRKELQQVLAAAKQQGAQASPVAQQRPTAGITPPGSGQVMSA